MLDLLEKKKTGSSKNFVTKSELAKLLKRIAKDNDKPLSKKVIEHIIDKATPTDKELISIVKPLIPAPIKGDTGDAGDITEITPDVIVDMMRTKRGGEGLYVDNIKGLKKHLNNILSNNKSIHNVHGLVTQQDIIVQELKSHIEKFRIEFSSGGDKATVNGTLTGTETIDDVKEDPKYTDGSHIFDETLNIMWTKIKVDGGFKWYATQGVPMEPQFVTESNENLLTESGDYLDTEQHNI